MFTTSEKRAVQQLATESGFSAFAGMDEFGGAPEPPAALAMAARIEVRRLRCAATV